MFFVKASEPRANNYFVNSEFTLDTLNTKYIYPPVCIRHASDVQCVA